MIGTTGAPSYCCWRKSSNSRPKPKRKTECNTLLQLLPYKRTYPKLVPQEDTDEELKRIENERTAERKVTFTQDYNKKRGPDHGSEQWARGQDFQRRNQNFTNDRFRRSSPNSYQNFSPRHNFTYRINSSNDRQSFDQRPNQSFNRNDGNRSRHESSNNQNGNWRKNGNFSRSPSNPRRDFSQNNSYRPPRNQQPHNFAFRRSDNRPTANFTPYEQKFPQNNNQTSSNVVRFTTTDDTINELSDRCPLNY